MGIFDTIIAKHNCPKCNTELEEYQTKELENSLATFKIGDKIVSGNKSNFEFDIHDSCSNCNEWIEALGVVKDNVLVEIKEIISDKN